MSTTEDHKKGGVYEVGYLVLPSVPEDNLSNVVSKIVSIIEKAGGKTLDSEAPYLEKLAYSMSKTVSARKYVVDEAYIGWMKFEAESGVVEGIKGEIEKIEEILRILLIKVPRETTFTFEAARKARAEKEEALNAPVEEELPVEEKIEAPLAEPLPLVDEPVVE